MSKLARVTIHGMRWWCVVLLGVDSVALGFIPYCNYAIGGMMVSKTTAPLFRAASELNESEEMKSPKKDVKAIILDPFPQAGIPDYHVTAPVGANGFLLSREGGPTKEELADENLYKIIDRTASDLEVNTLVWKCLGYRFEAHTKKWTIAEVFPKWKEQYPEPPDMVGMQRIYSKEVDGPCLRNNQALVRSIPVENKKSYLKEYMKPFGFTGYQVAELTPNMTRRAQCTNWLLFYREELYGYTVEQLRERRLLKQEKELQARQAKLDAGEQVIDEFKPPVKEIF
jgi:Domain of unknown function (DUF1823)